MPANPGRAYPPARHFRQRVDVLGGEVEAAVEEVARQVVAVPASRAEARRRVAAEIVERQMSYTSVSNTDTTNGITEPIAGTSACALPMSRRAISARRPPRGTALPRWPGCARAH